MEEDDADSDTHMCLRCQTMIVGLGNYVLHRRQLCHAVLAAKCDTQEGTIKGDQVPVVDQNSDATSTTSPISSDAIAVNAKPAQSDEFFSSLELQSRKQSMKTQQSTTGAQLRKQKQQPNKPATANQKRRILLKNNDYEVEIFEEEEDEDEDDDDDDEEFICNRRPPKGHTGGKWKPGSMPSRDRPNAAENPSSIAAPAANDAAKNQPTSYRCDACNVTTESEDALVQHLMEPSHWKESRSNPADHEALVLRYSAAMAPHSPFRCDICKFYFNSLEDLAEHWTRKWKRHTKVRHGFHCSLCSVRFNSSRSVMKHLLTDAHAGKVCFATPLRISVLPKKEFPCNACSYVARSSAAIGAHQKRSHSKKRKILMDQGRACRFCSARFSALRNLKAHVTKVHPTELFPCKSCDQTFFSKSQHYKHTKVHEAAGQLKTPKSDDVVAGALACKLCEFSCDIRGELLYHETALHTKAIVDAKNVDENRDSGGSGGGRLVKLYACPECEQLQPKRMLLSHLMDHTGEKPFKCNICSSAFASKNSLYQHKRGAHSEKNLACPHCDFKTYKKFRLQRHMTTHEILRPRPYLCEMCGADFLESYALRYHMKLHVGDKCNKCSFEGCDKAYRSPSELVVHVRTHTDERPFLCTECGYAAKTRHQLTKHERKHNGQRPFKCPHCPYAAKLSAQLWRHVRTHTGARPYSCPHCSYTCNTSENLRKHVLKSKKHQGLKIYICPYCDDFGCNSVKEFHEHLTNNHKEKLNAKESLTPTYLSLLSGVYDKSAATTAGDPNKEVQDKGADQAIGVDGDDSSASAAVTAAILVEDAHDAELRESLAFLKETEDYELKSGEGRMDEITMVSIELVEHSEETVITSDRFVHSPTAHSDGDVGDGALNAPMLDDGENSGLTADCDADTNTIVIYVPMQ